MSLRNSKPTRLIERIIDYLHGVFSRLYLLNIDPFRLVIPGGTELRGDVYTRQAHAVSRLILLILEVEDIVRNVSKIVRDAERQLLTSRVFSIEESMIIHGQPLWSQVPVAIATCRPIPQLVITRALSSPENLLLKYVVLYLYSLVEELAGLVEREIRHVVHMLMSDTLKMSRPIGYMLLLKKIDMLRSQLQRVLSRPLLRQIVTERTVSRRRLEKILQEVKRTYWKPSWAVELVALTERVLRLENMLADMKDVIKLSSTSRKVTVSILRRAVRYFLWRLYELYVLYIFVRALSELYVGHHRLVITDRTLQLTVHNERGLKVLIHYNVRPIDYTFASSVASGRLLDLRNNMLSMDLSDLCGRPDIMIKIDNIKVVCEVKFTVSCNYLTQSRFKVLGYLREFNTKFGILVFPGLIARRIHEDEETIQTCRLMKLAVKRRGIVLKLADSAYMFIVPIIPLPEYEQDNVKTIQQLIQAVLSLAEQLQTVHQ